MPPPSNAAAQKNLSVPHPSRLLRRVGSDDRAPRILSSWVGPCICSGRRLRRAYSDSRSIEATDPASNSHPERSEGSAFPDEYTRTDDSKVPGCHPDQSGPASCAPFRGASGRAAEGSWQPVNTTPTVPTSNLPLEAANLFFQPSTLNFQLSFLLLKTDNLKLTTVP